MRICVLGDGGWGTALAILLARKKYSVKLWGAFPGYLQFVKKKRENVKFLPGIKIPRSLGLVDDLAGAVNRAELIVLAVPTQYARSVLKKLKQYNLGSTNFLSVAKGIECKTTKRVSEIINDELGGVRLAVLSGPNIAYEVVRAIPSAAVCASTSRNLAAKIQNIFMTQTFRIYTHDDLTGVELAGALKNIIAIACGISDGLGFGTNTKAALLTRGLSEITRLGLLMGADYKTFSGLSGMGDLVTTCFSPNSRNRWLGEQLGKGKKLKTILNRTEMVIEGVNTTKSAIKLAKRYKVEMPITTEVFKVLYQNKNPRNAVQALMLRAKKKEA